MPFLTDLRNNGALIATRNGPRTWLAPFDDRAEEVAFEENYIQSAATYTPLALDTPHPDLPDYFLVMEGAREDIGGFYKWKRTYARIPDSREQFESYSWTVPGIGEQNIYALVSINSASTAAGITTFTCSATANASNGDSVVVSYTWTDVLTGFVYNRRVLKTCESGTSGSTVKVPVISDPGGTIAYQSLVRVEPGRDQRTEEVGSVVQLDYYLPGVSTGITHPQDIPIIEPLSIIDDTGRETTSFTADTSPTLTEWRTKVANEEQVCAVRSIVRRWMGNIYERATRYVRAI